MSAPARGCRLAALAGLALTAAGPSSSAASLTIDVRATSTTSGTVIDAKNVLFTGSPGDTVGMNVHAVITDGNGNPNDDGLLSVVGSFLGAPGGLLGDLRAQRTPMFSAGGSSNGLPQDLDADGDLDVGSNNDASSSNFFSARASGPEPPPGTALIIATLTWTYTGGSSDTTLSFRPRISGTTGSWFEDGSQITSSNVGSGAPVRIFVPEPASPLVPALCGATVLLARRRARQQAHPEAKR